jgi:hypothetical protein
MTMLAKVAAEPPQTKGWRAFAIGLGSFAIAVVISPFLLMLV